MNILLLSKIFITHLSLGAKQLPLSLSLSLPLDVIVAATATATVTATTATAAANAAVQTVMFIYLSRVFVVCYKYDDHRHRY